MRRMIRTTTILLTTAVMFLMITSIQNLHVQAGEEELPTLTGLNSNDRETDLDLLKTQTGRYPSLTQLFWTLETSWPNKWAPTILESMHVRGVVPVIEITVTDLDGFNQGDLDRQLEAMVETVTAWLELGDNRRIIIAPLPEPNLIQHSWGGDPQGFKDGYHKIRDAFIKGGVTPQQGRFIVSYSGWGNGGLTHEEFYPGDAGVDLVGFSQLNRNAPWLTYEKNFAIPISRITAFTKTEPILVIQTGSVVEGQDRNKWMHDMFRGLAQDNQVLGMIYFNRNKYEAGKQNDYRVVYETRVDAAFKDGMKQWASNDNIDWIFNGGLDRWAQQQRDALAQTGGFVDIEGNVFTDDIIWLAEAEITSGCNPPTNTMFCPDNVVTRGQMAAFLHRALPAKQPTQKAAFNDIEGNVFAEDIIWLAETGITSGCNPPDNTMFCPDTLVTRGQMAAFLHRALSSKQPTQKAAFVDIAGNVFTEDIIWLAETGITSGCNPPDNNRFCPDTLVTRAQMAAFLHRALQ